MAKRCKGLNSKCFLITYLMIVGFLLVLWMNKLPLMHEEQRDIPTDMLPYMTSPARSLPDFSLDTTGKLALTKPWFIDKWSFVYFSHSHCLPTCQPALNTLSELQASFASKHILVLVIGIDSEHERADQLSQFLTAQHLAVMVASGTIQMIDKLARTFVALFLRTDYSDGSYQIEQKHDLFLVDPKGRVYATFKPPYSSASIEQKFLKLRHFYAKTE